jgi:hypothetical protein
MLREVAMRQADQKQPVAAPAAVWKRGSVT